MQGLGYVGAAMATAVAHASDEEGNRIYDVVGIDLPDETGRHRVESIKCGDFPFATTDEKLSSALSQAHVAGNITATTDETILSKADIVVVDVQLDLVFGEDESRLRFEEFEGAIRTIGQYVQPGTLILIETTVPPGTCANVVVPALDDELVKRGFCEGDLLVAHSFERVMPGDEYLDSIVCFWRAYAGDTCAAAEACEAFLSSIVDVGRFPLSRLSSLTASEIAKVMENTYRAVNIAFIDEWTKYAEAVGVDLYEVVEAIRVRPTHSNIRFPGLGVGGYCLTKDPVFTPATVEQLHGLKDLDFPFSQLATKVNRDMPLHAVERLSKLLGDNFEGKVILVLGVSYRQDVGDTRHSPAETLVRTLETRGAQVTSYDPFVQYWKEMDRSLPAELPAAEGVDAVVFATPHREFQVLDVPKWLGDSCPVILDTVNVMTDKCRKLCRKAGIQVESVGRGDGL